MLLILGVMMCIPFAGKFVEPGQLFFTYLVIALVLAGLIVELYYFLNRTVKELVQFLEHIRNREFTVRFNEKEARGTRRNLYGVFNKVLETYREIRIEREVQFRFLEHIIELIEIGIIVFDKNGKAVLSNTAASNLLGIPVIRSWDQVIRKKPGLGEVVGSIASSGKVFFESGIPGKEERLALQVSRTRMLEESYSLMAIQDIRGMVEQKETGAWIGLLRTLNHEIKNSVTPISSLADTLLLILQHGDGTYRTLEEMDGQNLADIITSVETLQQRSRSLHAFVEEYHKLTRIPAPDPVQIRCNTLLEETAAFFRPELQDSGIGILVDAGNGGLEIRADRGLMDQVLINLVQNSIDALYGTPDPEIVLSCQSSPGEVVLFVKDNGEGIEEDILEDIFIPFFSTKSQGSGIGLSLVRQIMRLHGGHVRIHSERGGGTVVSLVFERSTD